MVAVAKHIIVRAFDREVEHFRGENLTAIVATDGSLWIQEDGAPYGESLGIFRRWEYVRTQESEE